MDSTRDRMSCIAWARAIKVFDCSVLRECSESFPTLTLWNIFLVVFWLYVLVVAKNLILICSAVRKLCPEDLAPALARQLCPVLFNARY